MFLRSVGYKTIALVIISIMLPSLSCKSCCPNCCTSFNYGGREKNRLSVISKAGCFPLSQPRTRTYLLDEVDTTSALPISYLNLYRQVGMMTKCSKDVSQIIVPRHSISTMFAGGSMVTQCFKGTHKGRRGTKNSLRCRDPATT